MYLSHGTFLEFMERYVDSLEVNSHDIQNEASISIFRNEGPGTSRFITRGENCISVQAPLIFQELRWERLRFAI
jgi:hypothetical protein